MRKARTPTARPNFSRKIRRVRLLLRCLMRRCAKDCSSAREPKLYSSSEIFEATIRHGNGPGPYGIRKRALRHRHGERDPFSQKLLSQASVLSTSIETRQSGVHAEAGKGLRETCYNRPINLLDTLAKVFGKILLTRVDREVNRLGLLCDELFGFRSRISTALQLARLVK
jgi:hypothetical protein